MKLQLQHHPLSSLAGKYDYYQEKNPSKSSWNSVEILINKNPASAEFPKFLIRDRRSGSSEFRELSFKSRVMSGDKKFAEVVDPILTYSSDRGNPAHYYYEFNYGIGIQEEEGVFMDGAMDFYLLSKKDFDFEGSYCLIPDFREVSYACSSAEIILYMDASKFNYSYDSLRLFVGTELDDLTQVPFTDFVRYRDGGTTSFKFSYNGKDYTALFPVSLSKNETDLKKEATINQRPVCNLTESSLHTIQSKLQILHYHTRKNK